MKIITLITRLVRGGAQRVALDTTEFLRSRGHDAVLWCGPQTGPEGNLQGEAEERGIPMRTIPELVREIAPWKDGLAVRKLAVAFREEKPDWVHTHSSKAGIVGREAARAAKVPRIAHTVHGWGFTPETPAPLRSIYIQLERREATRRRQGDRLLFVNEFDLEEGKRLGIVPDGEGSVIPPGIDLDSFEDSEKWKADRLRARTALGCGDEHLLGGFLGRLSAQKDPTLVLDVAVRLAEIVPELQWVMVGDGPLAPGLRLRTESDPLLRPRLRWVGLQADPLPWLAAMDFLIFPSRWEGAPLTVMEAMAASLPVLASDLPGVRDLLRADRPPAGVAPEASEASTRGSETIGLLAEPGSVEAFSKGVVLLARETGLRQSLGAAARKQAVARFGRERMLESLEAIYLESSPESSGR